MSSSLGIERTKVLFASNLLRFCLIYKTKEKYIKYVSVWPYELTTPKHQSFTRKCMRLIINTFLQSVINHDLIFIFQRRWNNIYK